MKDQIFNRLIQFYRYRFIPSEEKNNQEGILENIKSGVEFKGARLWSVFFAALIICIGINLNSIIVIIGGLLIAPLSGPLAGMGAAAAISDRRLMLSAAKNFLIVFLINVQRFDAGTASDRIQVTISNYPFQIYTPLISGAVRGLAITTTYPYEAN